MTQSINEPTAHADDIGASTDKATPAAKSRRPRRMARESRDAGAAAVADAGGAATKPVETARPAATPTAKPRGESKIGRVIALLSREQGATLAELVEATGWLPHTTRAALTGLKKKGHVIAKTSRDGVTCYRIEAA